MPEKQLYIIGMTDEFQTDALIDAQNRIQDQKKQLSGFNPRNILRNIRLDASAGSLRQKYKEEAVHERQRQSYLQGPLAIGAAQNATEAILKERELEKAKLEQVRLQLENDISFEGTEIKTDVDGLIRQTVISEVLAPMVRDAMDSEIDLKDLQFSEDAPSVARLYFEALSQSRLADATVRLENILKNKKKQEPDQKEQFDTFLGRKSNNFGLLNANFATNIVDTVKEIADAYTTYLQDTSAVDRVSPEEFVNDYAQNNIELVLAKTSGSVSTKVNHNADVRAVAYLNRKTGNEILKASLIAGGVSLIAFGAMRMVNNKATNAAAHIVAPGLGMIVGGVVRTMDTNRRLKIEQSVNRATAIRNGDLEITGAVAANELLQEMDTLLNSRHTPENLDELTNTTRRVKALMDLSVRKEYDLISGKDLAVMRKDLIIRIAEAKAILQQNGRTTDITPTVEDNPEAVAILRQTKEIEVQERGERFRKSLGSGVLGGLFGGAVGLISQEALAGIGRLVNDNFVRINPDTPFLGGLLARGETGIEKTVRWINSGEKIDLFSTDTPVHTVLEPTLPMDKTVSIDGNYSIKLDTTPAPLHLSIFDNQSNTLISEPVQNGRVTINSSLNNLPQNVVSKLNDMGFKVQDATTSHTEVIPHTTSYAAGRTVPEVVFDTTGTQHVVATPKGALWELNPNHTQNLVINDPSGKIILIEDGQFNADGKLINYSKIDPRIQENIFKYQTGGDVIPSTLPVIGTDGNEDTGAWHDHTSKLDKIIYNSNGVLTVHSETDGQCKDGCNHYNFDGITNKDGFSFETKVVEGANPIYGKALELHTSTADTTDGNSRVFTFLMHGDRSLNSAIVAVGTINASQEPNLVHLFTDGVFKLDPTDTDPNHLVKFENGTTMQLGLFSRMELVPADLNKMELGFQKTYGTSVLRDVFEAGTISKTTLPDGSTQLVQTTQGTLMPCKTDIPAYLHTETFTPIISHETSTGFGLKEDISVTTNEIKEIPDPKFTMELPIAKISRTVEDLQAAPIPVMPVPAWFNRSAIDYSRFGYKSGAVTTTVDEEEVVPPLVTPIATLPNRLNLLDNPFFRTPQDPSLWPESTAEMSWSSVPEPVTRLSLVDLESDLELSFGPFYKNIAINNNLIEQFSNQPTPEHKEVYLQALERVMPILETQSGLIKLDQTVETVVVPELRGDRELIYSTLQRKRPTDGKTYFEMLKDGEINIVCVGSGMYTQEDKYWPNETDSDLEALTKMNEQATRSLGVMKTVMDLVSTYPGRFIFLRGVYEHMNRPPIDSTKEVAKVEMLREWLLNLLGLDFVTKWEEFEEKLPLMAQGKDFIVTNSAPVGNLDLAAPNQARGYSLEEIQSRDPSVIFGLTQNYIPNPALLQTVLENTLLRLGFFSQNAFWIIGQEERVPKTLLDKLSNRLIQVHPSLKAAFSLSTIDDEQEILTG